MLLRWKKVGSYFVKVIAEGKEDEVYSTEVVFGWTEDLD
jgi:hypothetical protein